MKGYQAVCKEFLTTAHMVLSGLGSTASCSTDQVHPRGSCQTVLEVPVTHRFKVWALNLGPYLFRPCLGGDLKYGPLLRDGMQWVYKDSRLGGHTKGPWLSSLS